MMSRRIVSINGKWRKPDYTKPLNWPPNVYRHYTKVKMHIFQNGAVHLHVGSIIFSLQRWEACEALVTGEWYKEAYN